MTAKKKTIDKIELSSLDTTIESSNIETLRMYEPEKAKQTQFIDGDTDTIVEQLIKILKEDIKAIN